MRDKRCCNNYKRRLGVGKKDVIKKDVINDKLIVLILKKKVDIFFF